MTFSYSKLRTLVHYQSPTSQTYDGRGNSDLSGSGAPPRAIFGPRRGSIIIIGAAPEAAIISTFGRLWPLSEVKRYRRHLLLGIPSGRLDRSMTSQIWLNVQAPRCPNVDL